MKHEKSKEDTTLAMHWSDRHIRATHIRASGRVVLFKVATRLHVIAPFDDRLAPIARALGGRWLWRTKVWTLPRASQGAIVEALKVIYGAANVSEKIEYQP